MGNGAGLATYKPRVLADSGKRVFFDSADAIVPGDTNTQGSSGKGVTDAYQWEAHGEGSCTRPEGCASLLSSGRDATPSLFADASADGSDAYFLTGSSLVAKDPGAIDLYDARVGGGFPEPGEGIPCEGDSCQALPPEPTEPTLTTLLCGPGNPPVHYTRYGFKASKSCPKGKVPKTVKTKGGKKVKKCVAKRTARPKHREGGAGDEAHRSPSPPAPLSCWGRSPPRQARASASSRAKKASRSQSKPKTANPPPPRAPTPANGACTSASIKRAAFPTETCATCGSKPRRGCCSTQPSRARSQANWSSAQRSTSKPRASPPMKRASRARAAPLHPGRHDRRPHLLRRRDHPALRALQPEGAPGPPRPARRLSLRLAGRLRRNPRRPTPRPLHPLPAGHRLLPGAGCLWHRPQPLGRALGPAHDGERGNCLNEANPAAYHGDSPTKPKSGKKEIHPRHLLAGLPANTPPKPSSPCRPSARHRSLSPPRPTPGNSRPR